MLQLFRQERYDSNGCVLQNVQQGAKLKYAHVKMIFLLLLSTSPRRLNTLSISDRFAVHLSRWKDFLDHTLFFRHCLTQDIDLYEPDVSIFRMSKIWVNRNSKLDKFYMLCHVISIYDFLLKISTWTYVHKQGILVLEHPHKQHFSVLWGKGNCLSIL